MSRMLSTVLIVAIAAAYVAPASAADDDTSVNLQTLAIRATKKNSDVSPELKSIVDQLKKQFKFTGYTLLKKDAGDAKLKSTRTITGLPGGFEVQLTPVNKDDARVELRVEVTQTVKDKDGKTKKTPKIKTTLKMSKGKTTLLGGWTLEGEDVLILAITAK